MTPKASDFETFRKGARQAPRMEEVAMKATLSHAEWSRVQNGFKPRDMDDKWRIGFHDPNLEFYRSWTHTLVFKLHIDTRDDAVHCGPLFAARDVDWYQPNPDRDEATVVRKVMQWTLGLEGFADG